MKHVNTNRSASEKLESQFPIFYVACTTRGGLGLGRGSRLLAGPRMVRQQSYTSALPVGPGPCQMR